jgi:DHA2 family multidrug resistance protein
MPDAAAAGENAGGDGWTPARSAAGKRNPWLIVSVISLATFMEVLDASIANVSLRHIAGALSVTVDESTWVLTSYLVANAIVIPISGWLSDVIGRKRYYMISVALFTVSSLACGLAPNLPLLILARIIQGIGGGGLAPSEQSFLADTFPPKDRGKAFAAYGIVVVVGPVLGPSLGGIITDNIGWHWIFLINVPIGIASLFLVNTFVCEPAILEQERRAKLKGGLRVDYIGFILVALGLGCLELTLDRGEREDWFASGFITTTAIISGLSLIGLVVWELTRKEPIVDLKLFRSRNFSLCCLFMGTAGLIIFGTTQLIPQMLQDVQGYTATDAGLALTKGGIATLIAMPLAGVLSGKVQVRYLLFPGLMIQALALFYISGWSADISFDDAATGRLFQAMGLPFLFVPISTASYVGLRQDETNQASALLNVMRNLGGTIGIAWAQAVLLNREQVHQNSIVEGLNPLNPSYVQGFSDITHAVAGSGTDTGPTALGVLNQQVMAQVTMLSYLDVYRVFMIFVFIVAPLALLLRPAKPGQAGGH